MVNALIALLQFFLIILILMGGLPVAAYMFYRLIFNPDRKTGLEFISVDVKELVKQMVIVQDKLAELDEKIKQLEEKMP